MKNQADKNKTLKVFFSFRIVCDSSTLQNVLNKLHRILIGIISRTARVPKYFYTHKLTKVFVSIKESMHLNILQVLFKEKFYITTHTF